MEQEHRTGAMHGKMAGKHYTSLAVIAMNNN